MTSDTALIKKIGKEDRKFVTIANIDDVLYLFDQNTHTVVKVFGKNYTEEEKFCDTKYETAKMISVFPNMFLMDSVYSHEMQIMDDQGNVVFKDKSEPRSQQGSLTSIYYSGIENSGGTEKDKLVYFSRTQYSMYQFNRDKLKAQFTLSLDEKELLELMRLVACAEDNEINENDVYDLKIWTKKLERMEIMRGEVHCNCGEKILEIVKTILKRKCS